MIDLSLQLVNGMLQTSHSQALQLFDFPYGSALSYAMIGRGQ